MSSSGAVYALLPGLGALGVLGYLAAPLIGGPAADVFGYGAVAAVVTLMAVGAAATLAWSDRS